MGTYNCVEVGACACRHGQHGSGSLEDWIFERRINDIARKGCAGLALVRARAGPVIVDDMCRELLTLYGNGIQERREVAAGHRRSRSRVKANAARIEAEPFIVE